MIVGLGLLSATTAVCAPAEFLAPVVVPFKFEDSRIYVPVRAGAGAFSWFILDTGSTGTIVDRDFAHELHLAEGAQLRATGAGAGSSLQGRAGPLGLRVGPVPLVLEHASIMDLGALLEPTSGRHPAGIIGSQFFVEHIIEIDFRARRLLVWPSDVNLASRFARSIPLEFADHTPLANAELILPSRRKLPEKVLVDLGAKSTLLIPEPFIARNRLGTAFGKSVVLPLGAGVGGNTYYQFVRATALSLGGDPSLELSDPVVGLSVKGTLKSTWHEGLLGTDFLSRFRIALDYGRSRLLLTRQSDQPEPLDRSGMFLICSAGCRRILVRDVLSGGPADQAGIMRGDRLVSVGGGLTRHMSLSGIRHILKSRRSRIVIVVRRGALTIRRILRPSALV